MTNFRSIAAILILASFTAAAPCAWAQSGSSAEQDEEDFLEGKIGKEKDAETGKSTGSKGRNPNDPFTPAGPGAADPNATVPVDPDRIKINDGTVGIAGEKPSEEALKESEKFLSERLKKQIERFDGKIPPSEIGDRLVFRPSPEGRHDPQIRNWEEKRWQEMVGEYKDKAFENAGGGPGGADLEKMIEEARKRAAAAKGKSEMPGSGLGSGEQNPPAPAGPAGQAGRAGGQGTGGQGQFGQSSGGGSSPATNQQAGSGGSGQPGTGGNAGGPSAFEQLIRSTGLFGQGSKDSQTEGKSSQSAGASPQAGSSDQPAPKRQSQAATRKNSPSGQQDSTASSVPGKSGAASSAVASNAGVSARNLPPTPTGASGNESSGSQGDGKSQSTGSKKQPGSSSGNNSPSATAGTVTSGHAKAGPGTRANTQASPSSSGPSQPGSSSSSASSSSSSPSSSPPGSDPSGDDILSRLLQGQGGSSRTDTQSSGQDSSAAASISTASGNAGQNTPSAPSASESSTGSSSSPSQAAPAGAEPPLPPPAPPLDPGLTGSPASTGKNASPPGDSKETAVASLPPATGNEASASSSSASPTGGPPKTGAESNGTTGTEAGNEAGQAGTGPDAPDSAASAPGVKQRIANRAKESEALSAAYKKLASGQPLNGEEKKLLEDAWSQSTSETKDQIEKRQELLGKTVDDIKAVGDDLKQNKEEFELNSSLGKGLLPLAAAKGAGQVSIGAMQAAGLKQADALAPAMDVAEVAGDTLAGKSDGLKTAEVAGKVAGTITKGRASDGALKSVETVTAGLGMTNDVRDIADVAKTEEAATVGAEKAVSMTNTVAGTAAKIGGAKGLEKMTDRIDGIPRIMRGMREMVRDIEASLDFGDWSDSRDEVLDQQIAENQELQSAFEKEYQANQIRLDMIKCRQTPGCDLFPPKVAP